MEPAKWSNDEYGHVWWKTLRFSTFSFRPGMRRHREMPWREDDAATVMD